MAVLVTFSKRRLEFLRQFPRSSSDRPLFGCTSAPSLRHIPAGTFRGPIFRPGWRSRQFLLHTKISVNWLVTTTRVIGLETAWNSLKQLWTAMNSLQFSPSSTFHSRNCYWHLEYGIFFFIYLTVVRGYASRALTEQQKRREQQKRGRRAEGGFMKINTPHNPHHTCSVKIWHYSTKRGEMFPSLRIQPNRFTPLPATQLPISNNLMWERKLAICWTTSITTHCASNSFKQL